MKTEEEIRNKLNEINAKLKSVSIIYTMFSYQNDNDVTMADKSKKEMLEWVLEL